MSEQIKARPITFTAAMIPRILDGSKTQSRRVIRPQPYHNGHYWLLKCPPPIAHLEYARNSQAEIRKLIMKWPKHYGGFGPVAQRLYVQESFSVHQGALVDDGQTQPVSVRYRDTQWQHGLIVPDTHTTKPTSQPTGKWHSGRFMPQWASRIMLERTGARVERVQDISIEDALAEGIDPEAEYNNYGAGGKHRDTFAALWDSINLKRGHGWDANDWVDVVKFKVIESLAKNG